MLLPTGQWVTAVHKIQVRRVFLPYCTVDFKIFHSDTTFQVVMAQRQLRKARATKNEDVSETVRLEVSLVTPGPLSLDSADACQM